MREVIANQLFVGNALEARDIRSVVDEEISAIIDLAAEESPIPTPRDLVYCRFPLLDGAGNDRRLLQHVIDTCVHLLASDRKTLIACSAGMSRSPAIAAATLAMHQNIPLAKAISIVATSGPTDISPALWSEIVATVELRNSTCEPLLFVTSAIEALRSNKSLADRAIAQTTDANLHQALDSHTNSIVVVMKHVAGNLLSRWTDFLTTDGEKPDRNRDDEFVDTFTSRDQLLAYWESGWDCLFTSLQSLSVGDLDKTITIRGEPHSVPRAIQRSLGHTCYHVGQIVQLARHYAGDDWETLTIPRGKSQEFNEQKRRAANEM